ncbi:type I-E CRISPR-associated protein Cse2/CasB [Streptomyces sp. NPDC097981]|uniref:type I-E CRISPR-associated protein Cse2/CasB n=1 Tax=Streptomyces sp. NPDC097981 TaxID=3155428 RepID=UPI003324935B
MTAEVSPGTVVVPGQMSSPPDRYERFMGTVRMACATPGGRADLRQGLADGLSSPWQMYVHLLPAGGIPARSQTREAEFPFLLVASLYAVHDAPNPRTERTNPQPAPKRADRRKNLGWSYARAASIGATRQKAAAGALSQIAQLDLEDLYRDLPGAVSLLRSQRVPVQWPVLLRDLTRWSQWAEDVRIEWARAFYAPAPTSVRTNEETSS